jgi:hypothetical protein
MRGEAVVMDERRVKGYGADLGIAGDGSYVVIWPGKTMAKLAGTQRVQIPVGDIVDVEYRAANPFVNGTVKFKVRDETPPALNAYGGRVVPPDGHPAMLAFAKEGLVTTQTLVVHWRRKDQAAFAELVDEIRAKVAEAPPAE